MELAILAMFLAVKKSETIICELGIIQLRMHGMSFKVAVGRHCNLLLKTSSCQIKTWVLRVLSKTGLLKALGLEGFPLL